MYMRAADQPEALLESIGFSKEEVPKLLEMTKTSPESRKEYIRRFTGKLREWKAAEFEQHMIKRNTGAVIVPQSREKFLQSEQGQVVAKLPPVEIIPQVKPSGAKAGAWGPTPWSKLADPSKGVLHGIKYLELTRILMGPRIGNVLGIFNGNGIKVSSPALEDGVVGVYVDRGRSAFGLRPLTQHFPIASSSRSISTAANAASTSTSNRMPTRKSSVT